MSAISWLKKASLCSMSESSLPGMVGIRIAASIWQWMGSHSGLMVFQAVKDRCFRPSAQRIIRGRSAAARFARFSPSLLSPKSR